MGTKSKYIMVATVAIPKLPRDSGRAEEDPDDQEEKEDSGVRDEILPQLEEPREGQFQVEEEVAVALNEQWKKHIQDLAELVGVQNITLVEPLESRGQQDVTRVATRIFCRFKSMGLQINRVHTDRECAFISRVFQAFCRRFGLHQTMTGGDEGPSNGRIESEVQQVKRRLRMLVRESGLGEECWPGIARYVGEERLRRQCQCEVGRILHTAAADWGEGHRENQALASSGFWANDSTLLINDDHGTFTLHIGRLCAA